MIQNIQTIFNFNNKKNFKFFGNAAAAAFPNFGFSEIHTQPILILMVVKIAIQVVKSYVFTI
jgi:hypothetical protein